jgi:peptide chain release factor 3
MPVSMPVLGKGVRVPFGFATTADAYREFIKANQGRLAKDVDDNYAYLADTGVNLRLAQERWPKVEFHATREHGQQL